MIGSIRLNIWISLLVALSAFFLSFRVNPLFTSFIRSVMAFLIIFLAVFLIRALVSMVSYPKTKESGESASEETEEPKTPETGRQEEETVKDKDGAEQASEMIKELMNEDKK